MKNGQITIIQGGQYGSEGKGAVAAVVALRRGIQHAVRTGSINAGHTVFHNASGKYVKMQIIPTAWVNPGTILYLGPGTYIHVGILEKEVEMIRSLTGEDIRHRLIVDHRCVVMGDPELRASKMSGRHHTMGATGKGCSEAVIARLRDRGNPETWWSRMFKNREEAKKYQIADVPHTLRDRYERGEEILLEGTQGAHLDLILGPWPFTTNRSCNSAAWMAEAGLPSNYRQRIIMVCRTHPIRVAGNSGPLPHEIEWGQLARRMNSRMESLKLQPMIDVASLLKFEGNIQSLQSQFPDLPQRPFCSYSEEERLKFKEQLSEIPTLAFSELSADDQAKLKWIEKTTVTKKIRRIARLDRSVLVEAGVWNNPDEVIVTFLNYEFPEMGYELGGVGFDRCEKMGGVYINAEPRVIMMRDVVPYLSDIQSSIGAPITAITVGPHPMDQLDIKVSKE